MVRGRSSIHRDVFVQWIAQRGGLRAGQRETSESNAAGAEVAATVFAGGRTDGGVNPKSGPSAANAVRNIRRIMHGQSRALTKIGSPQTHSKTATVKDYPVVM